MIAETCESNIVMTQKLTKTIICLQSVMACLISLGARVQKGYELVGWSEKNFFLKFKKIPN